MPSLQAINAKIEKLRKQAEALQHRARAGAVERVLKLMNQLGVSVDDLRGAKGRRGRGAAAPRSKGVAKYRDPATGKTWTGHGRAPDWIRNAANRDEFLIDASAAAPAKAAKTATRGARKSAKANGPAAKRAKKTAARPAKKTAGTRKAKGRNAGSSEGSGSASENA